MSSPALLAFHRLLQEYAHLPPSVAQGYGFTGNIGSTVLRSVLAEGEDPPILDENDIFDPGAAAEIARRLDEVRRHLSGQPPATSGKFDSAELIRRIRDAGAVLNRQRPETALNSVMPGVVTSEWLEERGAPFKRQYFYLLNRLLRTRPDFDPIMPSNFFLRLGLNHSTMKRFRSHPYTAEIQRVALSTGIHPMILAWFAMEDGLGNTFDITPFVLEDRGRPAQSVLLGAVTMVPTFESLFRDIDNMLREAHMRQLAPRSNQTLVATLRNYAASRDGSAFSRRYTMKRLTLPHVARFLAATFSTQETAFTYNDMLLGLRIFFGYIISPTLTALYDPHQGIFVMPQSYDPQKDTALSRDGQPIPIALYDAYTEDAVRPSPSPAQRPSTPEIAAPPDDPFGGTVKYWEQNKTRLRREFNIVPVKIKRANGRAAEIGAIVLPAGITDLNKDVSYAIRKFRLSHGGRREIARTIRETVAILESDDRSSVTADRLAELAGRLVLYSTAGTACLTREGWLAALRVFANTDGVTDFIPVVYKNGSISIMPPHLALDLEKGHERVDTAATTASPVRSLTGAVRAISGSSRPSAAEIIEEFTAALLIDAIHFCVEHSFATLNTGAALSVLEMLARSPAGYGATENGIIAAAAHMLYAFGGAASSSDSERAALLLAGMGHHGLTPAAIIEAFPATRPNWSPAQVHTILSRRAAKAAAVTTERVERNPADTHLNLVPHTIPAMDVIDMLEARRNRGSWEAEFLLRGKTIRLSSARDLDHLIEGGNFRFGITRDGKIVASLLRASPGNLREVGARLHGVFRFSLSHRHALADILSLGNSQNDQITTANAFRDILGFTTSFRRNLINDPEEGGGGNLGGGGGNKATGGFPAAGGITSGTKRESLSPALAVDYIAAPTLPLATAFPFSPVILPPPAAGIGLSLPF